MFTVIVIITNEISTETIKIPVQLQVLLFHGNNETPVGDTDVWAYNV